MGQANRAGSRTRSRSSMPPRKRSEGETATDYRSKIVGVVIGDAGAMRNSDGQTAAHIGIRNSGKQVETLGDVTIRIERPLVKGARAGGAETGCLRAGRGNTEVVLQLMIPGESDVGFFVDGVFCARPPDLHSLGSIKIVVFDAAQAISALGRGANAQRIRRVILPDVFVAGKEPESVPGVLESAHECAIVGDDAIFRVVGSD